MGSSTTPRRWLLPWRGLQPWHDVLLDARVWDCTRYPTEATVVAEAGGERELKDAAQDRAAKPPPRWPVLVEFDSMEVESERARWFVLRLMPRRIAWVSPSPRRSKTSSWSRGGFLLPKSQLYGLPEMIVDRRQLHTAELPSVASRRTVRAQRPGSPAGAGSDTNSLEEGAPSPDRHGTTLPLSATLSRPTPGPVSAWPAQRAAALPLSRTPRQALRRYGQPDWTPRAV
jgi:hypothetical protein